MKRLCPSHIIPLPVLAGLLVLPLLSACSYETRDRLWKKFDPAGYKHAHSEVFNPHGYQRYQKRGAPPDTLPPLEGADVDLMR